MQPIMPTAVRRWMPGHIGLGTAIYTNGLLVGEIFPTLLTIPVLLPLVDDSWRAAFVWWSVPIALIAVVIHRFAPRPRPTSPHAVAAPQKWLPDWRSGLVWRLGALFCCVNAMYFSANAFIPIYLASKGRPDLISSSLLALNLGQLPASLLLLAIAGRVERRAWPFAVASAITLVALAGIAFDVGPMTIWWSALLGFPVAAILIFALALPPLLCAPDDVARTAAGVFTISYGASVMIALVCGAAWDLTGIPAFAFAPLGVCAVALVGIAMVMRGKGELL
jgi:CP family cyanate transporter-like MFS transporter